MNLARWLRHVHIAVAILGSLLCLDRAPAAESGADKRPMLRVPATDSTPVVDGKLDETCWKDAAKTGPLAVTQGKPSKSTTEAFILRDADHLYVGVSCAGKDAADGEVKPSKAVERVELLIDSNGDRNSYYMVRITPEDGGKVACSYNEHDPPWYDRTWQPRFKFAAAKRTGMWAVELALPLEIFNKNKTLASEIEFNVSRSGMPGGEIHSCHGTPANPDEWGILAGIPSRDRLPKPDYVKPAGQFSRLYRAANRDRRSFLAEQEEQTIPLGPGSAHPVTTGEVMLELEGFLMEGDPHAMGFVWDLAVDERTGELYVLFDPRLARGLTEVRMNPTLPRASVRDLCRKMAREGAADLVIPKMFEVSNGEISVYGEWWTHPQKLTLAPNGDLIMSNIYRGTLWRMRSDGSLPLEGWTSVYNPDRNEPFDSTFWTQNSWKVRSMRNYLPFHSLHYPYFCFGPNGAFYMSAGQSSLHTRHYGFYWEVGEQPGSVFVRPPRPQHYGEASEEQESYHWSPSGTEGRGAYVWKCRMLPGVKVEKLNSFGGFAEPSGLVLDGAHLIVADAGNNRLRVLDADGRAVASITHYEHEGKEEPLNGPTALAIDREKNLYVLVGSEPRSKDQRSERTLGLLMRDVPAAAGKPPEAPRRLIKLKSWRQPELLAASKPFAPDVLQIAVDAGVSPSLV
ncbi:MAG: sugar-binding protein, partial [Planctomycetota bacterium]